MACHLLGAALLFPFGLAAGSFLEVALDRLPRGESVLWPPSHCRACGHRLSPAELVPILSFLIQRGRCRACRAPIGGWVPIREGLSGLALAVPWAILGCTRAPAALGGSAIALAVLWGIEFARNRG